MKAIIVKVQNTQATINTETVMLGENQPTVIAAGRGVNYEFLEQSSGHAPDHIITKRVADDLHVSFAEDGATPNLILQDFYSNAEQALMGMAEDGNYYYYIPDTAEVADYVTQLAPGDVEGQALGGPAQPSPWWVGQSDEGFAILPWLIGLAGLGLVAAALGSDDDNSDDVTPDTPEIPKPTLTAEEDGSVTVMPTEEATQTDVTYIDEAGNEQTPTFTKDSDTGKWLDNNPEDSVTVNPDTGEVTIPADEVKDGSEVEATQTTPKGESAPATAIAGNDIPLAPTISFEATGPDGIYNLEEVGDDGTIIATVSVPEGTEIGDVLTINGTDYPLTQDVIDNGQMVAIPPSTEVVASITSAAGKKGPDATDTAPNADLTPPEAPTIDFESTGDDDVYNADEVGEDGTINATVNVPEGTEIGDTLTINDVNYQVTQDILDNGQDIEIEPSTQVIANVTDAAGNAGPNANDTSPSADTDGPDDITTQLVINNVTADNVINGAEVGGDVAVTGKVTGEFTEGDEVTLVINGNSQTSTVDAQGSFSIEVPGSDLVADSDNVIDGSVIATDSAGNTGTVEATKDYAVDTDSPNTPVIDFESTGDDYIYNAEEVGEDGTITATVTVPEGTEIGDKLTINGIDYAVTQDIIDNGQDLEITPDTEVIANITDMAGNPGPIADDTAPPADTRGPNSCTTKLVIDAITEDNIINTIELIETINITGTVSGEFTQGDQVTLAINDIDYLTTLDINGLFGIEVLGLELGTDADTRVVGTANVTDAAGNQGTITKAQDYTLQLDADAITPTSKMASDIHYEDLVQDSSRDGALFIDSTSDNSVASNVASNFETATSLQLTSANTGSPLNHNLDIEQGGGVI